MEKDRDSSNQNPSSSSESEEAPLDIFAAAGLLEEWSIPRWYEGPRKPQFVLDDDKGWEVL